MANSVDPDQTAPEGTVWSGSTLFIYAILSETLVNKILGHLNYEHLYVSILQIILLGIIKDGALEVTQMGDGDYAARQRRISFWNDMKLTIYNERNGTYFTLFLLIIELIYWIPFFWILLNAHRVANDSQNVMFVTPVNQINKNKFHFFSS